MARAFSVFANQGREVTTIAIRSVEDRNGRIILEPEKDLRTQQKKKGAGMQVISQQSAAVMVDMLSKVVRYGTLSTMTNGGTYFTYTDAQGKKYTIPAAGKTGTTQNWADAWTVGFTPYFTTAIWFGFDRPGNSLGTTQSSTCVPVGTSCTVSGSCSLRMPKVCLTPSPVMLRQIGYRRSIREGSSATTSYAASS